MTQKLVLRKQIKLKIFNKKSKDFLFNRKFRERLNLIFLLL